MQVIRKTVYTELEADDIVALEMLESNLSVCRNEHSLRCTDCIFNNIGDACLPTLAHTLLARKKGDK